MQLTSPGNSSSTSTVPSVAGRFGFGRAHRPITPVVKLFLRIIKRLSRKKGDLFYRMWRAGLKMFYSEDRQFEAFDDVLWEDGYHHTGEVMNPANSASDGGQGVTYYEIYRGGVQPFVVPDSNVLEIGPGRGSWTKALLRAQEVWALDAKSLENNRIMDYLGSPKNLRYVQVSDFECADLSEDYFDFLFSYGVFCHIPWDGIAAYMRNLYPKLKTGAPGIISISDDKKNPDGINYGEWYPGCFVPNNSERMSELLTEIGYTVHDPDFLKCLRDSIVKFEK